MKTFADKIIAFNAQLTFQGTLPEGISVMNPYRENKQILDLSSLFYRKYYSDDHPRHLVLGINPGRFGGGITGIPFTDPKRLTSACGLPFAGALTHEPSSVFIYDMIAAFGGPLDFYRHFHINSVCPLGFTATGGKGKEVNYNYYDSKALTDATYDFIVQTMEKYLAMGFETDTCFCLGTGKNENFLRRLNAEKGYFKNIVSLEHPRYIMQYKSGSKQFYIDKYLAAFESVIR